MLTNDVYALGSVHIWRQIPRGGGGLENLRGGGGVGVNWRQIFFTNLTKNWINFSLNLQPAIAFPLSKI